MLKNKGATAIGKHPFQPQVFGTLGDRSVVNKSSTERPLDVPNTCTCDFSTVFGAMDGKFNEAVFTCISRLRIFNCLI